MFPHPVFQVAGHTCVERSLGFVAHDVERGLSHDRCTVMDSRLRGNDGGGLRRRESIEYDSSSDVGWAKRNVPNTQMLPFPMFVKLLVRIAKLPSPMFPHPVFQVTGHVCVECFLGFACHDVEGGLFYDRRTVMDSRLRGNDGGGLRRRESTGRYSELYRLFHFSFVGWAKRSVPNALDASIPDVCQATCLNCQAAKSDVPTSGFSGCWSRLCRAFPWVCLP